MVEKKTKAVKNPLLLDFAKKIRNRRHELGLTQEELAEKADLHVNYIGGIERASRNPTLETIVRIAKALKVSPKNLIPE